MIRSYRHKGLQRFAEAGSKSGIQPSHAKRLRNLLTALDAANGPLDMNAPRYALHPLHGELEGHWAVRVSGNWRWPLPLRARMRFWRTIRTTIKGRHHDPQSGAPWRSIEGLSGLDERQGGGGASARNAGDSFPDPEWACRHHGWDVLAAFLGTGHFAGVLAEDAIAIRPLASTKKDSEGSAISAHCG